MGLGNIGKVFVAVTCGGGAVSGGACAALSERGYFQQVTDEKPGARESDQRVEQGTQEGQGEGDSQRQGAEEPASVTEQPAAPQSVPPPAQPLTPKPEPRKTTAVLGQEANFYLTIASEKFTIKCRQKDKHYTTLAIKEENIFETSGRSSSDDINIQCEWIPDSQPAPVVEELKPVDNNQRSFKCTLSRVQGPTYEYNCEGGNGDLRGHKTVVRKSNRVDYPYVELLRKQHWTSPWGNKRTIE
ncbi:hypothetical protein MHLP_03945 [Candidatus Mycoplasma haematolamae str. Purdue]|uniref:Uncharacterized protein n=1 Tax=Mycoplasma haematolamae (strain Purdue) TaxID=1212765 RepID=I7CKE4_MYCHA|nr:hypothetical protein [Candidatus Mycoplasma haematolamae]AFO52369.1 hypothetical protein MHLP_03945 [Candidatus Mycoplasma haematolamae str. Purdue]